MAASDRFELIFMWGERRYGLKPQGSHRIAEYRVKLSVNRLVTQWDWLPECRSLHVSASFRSSFRFKIKHSDPGSIGANEVGGALFSVLYVIIMDNHKHSRGHDKSPKPCLSENRECIIPRGVRRKGKSPITHWSEYLVDCCGQFFPSQATLTWSAARRVRSQGQGSPSGDQLTLQGWVLALWSLFRHSGRNMMISSSLNLSFWSVLINTEELE